MPSFKIAVLPEQDFQRLREIADSGTVDGEADTLTIIKYLASAIAQVAEGQKQTPKAIQNVLDASGLGR